MCFCEKVRKTENIGLFEGFNKELPVDDFYKSVSRDLRSLSSFCFCPPLQNNHLKLLTVQLPCHFTLSFSETWYTTAQMQASCKLGLGRELRYIAKWKKQNIDWVLARFFPLFCQALESKLYTLAPRIRSGKCLFHPVLLPNWECSVSAS